MNMSIELLHRLFTKIKAQTLATHGANMVEYALLAAMLGLGSVAGVSQTANSVNKAYTKIYKNLKAEFPKAKKSK